MTITKEPWLVVRVELLSGLTDDFDPPPGRDFLAHPHDSFAAFARAINTAFARWDLGHLHEFMIGDRCIGPAYDDSDAEDEETVELGELLATETECTYIFDFGDNWRHRCRVLSNEFDPDEEFGGPPDTSPIPIFGWGSIPDQYSRDRPDND